jgi:hypothetical protein
MPSRKAQRPSGPIKNGWKCMHFLREGVEVVSEANIDNRSIIKRVSWFKSSLLLSIKMVDITNINS